MKRSAFLIAFALGLLATVWVTSAVASSHPLVLAMSTLIGAVYVFGALELNQYRATTRTLQEALDKTPADLAQLDEWLVTLPAGLHNTVRQRIDGEGVALPGPTFTPFLVGLLVMLGMLGTFLGMVVTLNGAVFALEGSSNVAGIRAAFSEPIKGLGLAFGTSVAGVATSAMLGLMNHLARRERAQASHTLDTLIATRLRRFSLVHQRQESFVTLQEQAQALPQVLSQLQAMLAQMTQSSEQWQRSLLANQTRFHTEVQAAYTGLAQSVDQSLRTSLSQSLHLASEGMRPIVQDTLAHMAAQAQNINAQLLDHTRDQLSELKNQMAAVTAAVAQTSADSLAHHEQTNARMTEQVGQTLHNFSQNAEQSAQALIAQLQAAQTAQQTQQDSAEQARQQAWQAALTQLAQQLHSQWQSVGDKTLAQQQAICDTLTQTAQQITTHSQTQATQTLAEVTRLMASSEALMQARMASEVEWTRTHSQRANELTQVLRTELSALRDAEELRGQAAVARLDQLQAEVSKHLGTLGQALEAPITQLIATASEAPKAAAEVIGQMRQEISHSVARDNALLEERTRILETLSNLLQTIHHASTEQRGVIDALLVTSQTSLSHTSEQFQLQVAAETGKLGDMAAQVTASAVDVASLSEAMAFAVRSFSETNDKLMSQLHRIEQAIDKSMTRSDEQLAYYVAQAREIIDLSITSQQDVLQALQHRSATSTEEAV